MRCGIEKLRAACCMFAGAVAGVLVLVPASPGQAGTTALPDPRIADAVETAQVANRIEVKAPVSGSNADLEKAVKAALRRDPYVTRSDIAVGVDRGVARLYGVVDTYDEKRRAERAAERVSGIARVVNNLLVREGTYDPDLADRRYDYPLAKAFLPDSEIEQSIGAALQGSPHLAEDEISVTVAGGKAFLRGEVDSWSEWRLARHKALQGGASWVVNNLKVDTEEG